MQFKLSSERKLVIADFTFFQSALEVNYESQKGDFKT